MTGADEVKRLERALAAAEQKCGTRAEARAAENRDRIAARLAEAKSTGKGPSEWSQGSESR